MWLRWVSVEDHHGEHVPGLRGLNGIRRTRRPPAHRRVSQLRERVRLRGGARRLRAARSGDVKRRRPGGRRGTGEPGGPGMRRVRLPPLDPVGPPRVARGRVRGMRDRHPVHPETGRSGAAPWARPFVRGRGAARSTVPQVRRSTQVLHRGGRAAGRRVRGLRQPVHAPASPRSARRGPKLRGSETLRGRRLPAGTGGSTSVPKLGSRGSLRIRRPGAAAQAASPEGRIVESFWNGPFRVRERTTASANDDLNLPSRRSIYFGSVIYSTEAYERPEVIFLDGGHAPPAGEGSAER